MAAKTYTGREAIQKVLADGEPKPAKEITSEAVKLATGMKGKTPQATLSAFLYTQAKKNDGMVVQVGVGTFRLRREDEMPAPVEKPKRERRTPAKATATIAPAEPVETLPPSRPLTDVNELDAEIAKREQAKAARAEARKAKPDPKPASKKRRSTKVAALVESGLADDAADAKAQLADMGE